MLALKVHRGKRPNTRGGSFWIPIVDWKTARRHLKNWIGVMSRRKPIRYITLIGVPNRHPVFVAVDWSVYAFTPPKERPFVPLCEVEQSLLVTLKPLTLRLPESAYYIGQNHTVLGSVEAGESLASYPEMVLGADLPRHCIKWTKDIRLLAQGDRRQKLRETKPELDQRL